MDNDRLRRLLESTRTVAIVGLSDKPERDSNEVARYLISMGYRVIPVNPHVASVLGEPSYPNLAAIPPSIAVDIVDIFRKSSDVGPIVEEAIPLHPKAIWMQLGVQNEEAALRAQKAGIPVLQDLCIMGQHRRLRIGPKREGP